MNSRKVRWSDLPKELLATIAKHLDIHTDVLRFRAVCSSWRSSLSPLLILSPLLSSIERPFFIAPNPAKHPKHLGYFSLIESTVYYLEPLHKNPNDCKLFPKGWLVKVREDKSGKMSLLHPLSKVLFDLPHNCLPKVFNLLNFQISEVKKVHDLQFVDLLNNSDTVTYELRQLIPKKVAVPSCSSGTGLADDYAIMTIHMGGNLGYLTLADKKWTSFDDGQLKSYYDDVVYHRGHFYAVDFKGRVLVIDSSSLKFREIAAPVYRVDPLFLSRFKHLVESFGDLFFVDSFFDEDPEIYCDGGEPGDWGYLIHFDVYKLNVEDEKWVPVKTLGDRAFFVGDDCSFSVSARDFPGCIKNCIYFKEVCFAEVYDFHPGYEVSVYDLKDGTNCRLSYLQCHSEIFWPPPDWLR